ncbi:hypothetical protein ACES2I_15070 [Bdellovibrio bacteriovorus]|uniref:hypothetical protein n=1 Tax=Bdellovibrio bacteriovorus TaxID=959 RepID=UPI0035A711AE
MNTRDVNKIAILGMIVSILSACSDASPTVSILRSMESLEFNPNHVVTSSLNSVPLQASCSNFIGSIDMSLDGGATWITPTSYDVAAPSACVNGKFTVSLSNLKSPWSSLAISPGQTLKVKFRAQPRKNNFFYKEVTVLYSPSSTRSQEVLIGSAEQAGGGYRVKSRLRHQQQHVAAGGNFKIKGRISE